MGRSVKIRPDVVGAAIDRMLAARALPDVAAAMREAIALCEQDYPHPDWARLRVLDFAGEIPALRAWFERTLATYAPATPLRGLYFALSHPAGADDEPTLDLDLVGTEAYDPADADMQWLFSRHYMPDVSAGSKVLGQLYSISYNAASGRPLGVEPLGNDAEWALGLTFAILAGRAIVDGRRSTELATDVDRIGVAAGWGEGDLLPIGELTKDGFVAASPPV
jgi:hypothetical protein